MGLYIDHHRDTSLTGRVIREWNSGQELPDAQQHLLSWYGFNPQQVADVWAALEAEYQEQPVPFSPERRRKAYAKHSDMAYLAWRGDIGPGKQLRDILAAAY